MNISKPLEPVRLSQIMTAAEFAEARELVERFKSLGLITVKPPPPPPRLQTESERRKRAKRRHRSTVEQQERSLTESQSHETPSPP